MPYRYYFQACSIARLKLFNAPLVVGLICFSQTYTTLTYAAPTPALKPFMEKVWQQNPSIQAATSAVAIAKSQKNAAAQSIYNPEIEFDLEKTDTSTISIGFSQTIDFANKRSAASTKADASIQFAQAILNQQRVEVSAEVLFALANLQSINALNKLAEQRVILMQELLDTTQKRKNAGDVGQQNISLARVALSQAKMQLANSTAQKAKYETQLQVATEFFSTQWPTLSYTLPTLSTLTDRESYLSTLPSIKALNSNVLAAKANVTVSKAERKADPRFGLRGGTDNGETLLGVSFSMPLFIRNNYRAEIETANHEVFQHERLLLSAMRRAEAELIGTHKRYQLISNAWHSWNNTGLNSLNEQMDLIHTIWTSGEMSTSEYLVQAKQNVDAQETAVELSAQLWEAWIEWLVASGQIQQWINNSIQNKTK